MIWQMLAIDSKTAVGVPKDKAPWGWGHGDAQFDRDPTTVKSGWWESTGSHYPIMDNFIWREKWEDVKIPKLAIPWDAFKFYPDLATYEKELK